MGTYKTTYQDWLKNPRDFWAKAADGLPWKKRFSETVDDSNAPLYRWFKGGEINACQVALDHHIENGRADQAAIIYESPVTGTRRTISYKELLDEVAIFAGALQSAGIEKGDRVVIYMPMIPEAVVGMLACARLGAIHSVVFGGFAAKELATRIEDAQPKAILSASCGIEPGRTVDYKTLLDDAIDFSSHKPSFCVIQQREQLQAPLEAGRDHDWNDFTRDAVVADCADTLATDPLYILYTSGTTGLPKGVVRDIGGSVVALNWSMSNVYGVNPGDVFFAASDIGWVVGHSYIVYGPLFAGCTSILFEGKPVGTPDAGAYWKVIEENRVKALFTAPTAFRAIKKEDPEGEFIKKYDISSLDALFLAGERADPDTVRWAEQQLQKPVIDHWWQTELGWPALATCLGMGETQTRYGSAGFPVPGFEFDVLDENGNKLGANEEGMLAIKLPLAPGSMPTLWNGDDRFKKFYLDEYPGYYLTGDSGYRDETGFVFVMGRTDDIINVAGHRLSTGLIEEVVSDHPDIAECAVIGVADDLKGQIPVGLVVLKSGVSKQEGEIRDELVTSVRDRIGPVAVFKAVSVVDRLPKTRSGKILRGVMRKMADGQDYVVPATIEDPAMLDEIKPFLVK